MFDTEREQSRKTYQLCRFGFGSYGAALLVAAVDRRDRLAGDVSPRPGAVDPRAAVVPLARHADRLVPVDRSDRALGPLGPEELAAQNELLLALCLADVVLWFVARGEVLGLHGGDIGHEWLRGIIREAMSWGRMALLSSLAGDYLVHLGVENARESDKLTRSMTVTGALVWMLFVCQQTNWAAWPLQHAGPAQPRKRAAAARLHADLLDHAHPGDRARHLGSAAEHGRSRRDGPGRSGRRPASSPVRRFSRLGQRLVA